MLQVRFNKFTYLLTYIHTYDAGSDRGHLFKRFFVLVVHDVRRHPRSASRFQLRVAANLHRCSRGWSSLSRRLRRQLGT